MDDLQFGTRNKRGDWAPDAVLEFARFLDRPFRLRKLLAWVPHYLWPRNAFHLATALIWWFFVVPDVGVMQSLGWGWAVYLYAVNAAAIFVFYGAIELFWYVKRRQGTRFKFNAKFLGDQPSDVFWFKSQNIDNFLRSFLVTIPLWTAVRVLLLWSFANGHAVWLSSSDSGIWLVVLMLVASAIHELQFFAIHRLIHTLCLYKWVHTMHHNSINPSPWRSFSMHPVEGLSIYHVALWHLVIPSNPIVAVYQPYL